MARTSETIHYKSSNHVRVGLSAAALAIAWGAPAFAQVTPDTAPAGVETAANQLSGPDAAAPDQAAPDLAKSTDHVIVTARRVAEDVQNVPIAVSVLDEDFIKNTGAFNPGQLGKLVPSLQFYSTNPRNSALNIRGLGAPFGLTNDGIEQGVGLYIDGVYYARPASATLDFIDIEQVEVLRGPQGTLYGKNTTAGAINVTTKAPSFTPETEVELSFGNIGFEQAKITTTGAITPTLAGRLSFSGTQRDGVLHDVNTGQDVNDLNNLGVRGQLLWTPTDDIRVTFSGDYTRQRPKGYESIFAGVAPTQRPLNRQYAAQAAFFNYTPPSTNAFDRLTDLDPHRSYQDLGGASINVDWKLGNGTLTSITAWRYWLWDPTNDRDFLGLPITTVSQNPSKQFQWSQELRYAGELGDNVNYVVGAYAFDQVVKTFGRQEQGPAAWRFLLNPNAQAQTPGLLDGYGQRTDIGIEHKSAALFANVDWKVTDKLHIVPGLRLNYDKKDGHYIATTYGGLQTTNAALIALQQSVLAPQNYAAKDDDTNVSGQLTVSYELADNINAYATYATAFKTFGLNNNGLPLDANNQPALSAATVKPEDEKNFEIGLKTRPLPGVTANIAAFRTDIDDFQANVVNGQVGVIRGYLANAKKARVQGVEFDTSAAIGDFTAYFNGAWTDGEYVSFPDAPPPLELSGGSIQVYDASHTRLPGLSKYATSLGGEYVFPGQRLLGRDGEFFVGADANYRSNFSSSAIESPYLDIKGYTLVNARVGFRGDNGWDVFLWGKNLFDKDYFEVLSAGGSSSGYYAGLPGDPRTYGVTLRGKF
ncbi:MAG TPA: TonB-dependent receptor [Hyphomonadaceae bacterium]|nr:TonB-dependent receptor [Hyphomonadaceae bacterium]